MVLGLGKSGWRWDWVELGLGKSGWRWDWLNPGGVGTGYTCGDGKQKCKQELLPFDVAAELWRQRRAADGSR